jgi:uncharacterized protein YjbJ (UPF0337 family)
MQGDGNMASNILAGNWKQLKGKIKQQWGKLTDDDFDVISGKRDELIGRLQAAYGKSRAEVEKEVDEFFDRMAEKE